MIDPQDHHRTLTFVDVVDDPVGTSPSRVQARQLTLQPTSYSMGVVDQGRKHELHDRGCRTLWQPLQLALRWPGDSQLV